MKTTAKIFLSAILCLFCLTSFAEFDVRQMNKKFGINLFQDANIWDDSGSNLMQRLGAKFQTTKAGNKTISATYAKGKVLKAEIEQLRITEIDGKVAQIDMVFFNKGDSVEGKKWTQKLQREMMQQWQILETSLNEIAGKSTNGTWGFGRTKNKAKIWKFENYMFNLEFKPKEFIILHIIHPDFAKQAAKKQTASDTFDGKKNVSKEPNGDIYIENIPMVDQGPKGYCVPATIERCLKYYNITDVDMHKIAAVCDTRVGGGTTIDSVMTDFKKVCNTFKLKMSNVSGFSINSIAAKIDNGIPIGWTLFATDDFLKRMIANSDKRANSNFTDYCKDLKTQDKLKKRMQNPHICLIIGYNKKSKEIAVSNSWGDRFKIHWVRFDDAKVVARNAFVINPR